MFLRGKKPIGIYPKPTKTGLYYNFVSFLTLNNYNERKIPQIKILFKTIIIYMYKNVEFTPTQGLAKVHVSSKNVQTEKFAHIS